MFYCFQKEKEERRKRGQKHSPLKEFAISLDCAEIKDLEVKFLEKRIIVTYTIDDDHYELDQTLPRPIVPEV